MGVGVVTTLSEARDRGVVAVRMQHRPIPDFDVILVDNPPALVAIDAFLVASETEGSIIMVMRSGKTRGLAAKELRMSLERLGLKLRGVIMNDVPAFELGGYYSKSLEYYRLDPARKK